MQRTACNRAGCSRSEQGIFREGQEPKDKHGPVRGRASVGSVDSDQFGECVPNHADEVLDVGDGLVHQGRFVCIEIDLDDLFDPTGSQNAGHADEVAADTVFGIAIGGTGQDAFLSLMMASAIWTLPEAGA